MSEKTGIADVDLCGCRFSHRRLPLFTWLLAAASMMFAGTAQAQFTGDYQTNTIDGVVSNWVGNGSYVVGSNNVFDVLQIINAGVLSNGYGYLGYEVSSSNNIALVTGSGSVWSNQGDLDVGYQGAGNQLTISSGGQVVDGYGYIGSNTTATANSVLVTGLDSVWSNAHILSVGYVGSGNQLTIANGGQVADVLCWMGYNSSSSNNSVLVTDSGSLWNNQGSLYVGYRGAGNQLTITNGGQVVNNTGWVGYNSSSNNSALVTGSGSVWSNKSDLGVGYNGPGNQLTVSNGGAVASYNGYVGRNFSSSNNVVLVTGSGSVWSNQVDLDVGYNGPGNQLIITNGGQVVNYYGRLGFGGLSSNNVALVTGSGSLWSNWGSPGDLYVGEYGAGNQLTIANGGQVVGLHMDSWVGGASSNNAVLVTGSGSIWDNGGALSVGTGGAGNQLTITNGGQVLSASAYLGGYLSSDVSSGYNSALVTGSGSVWRNRGQELVVGYSGPGNQLTIANGGQVISGYYSYLGYNTGSSNNSALVTGSGSVWSNGFNLHVGYNDSSSNSLAISNGGMVIASNIFVAPGNSVTLSGGKLIVAEDLLIWDAALLSGSGTISGGVLIAYGGQIQANCGGTLTFTGIVTNNGTMSAIGGSVLEFYGDVVNSGVLDIINGSAIFHGAFINNGTVLDASSVRISNISIASEDVVIQIPSVVGHSYQLQMTASLDTPAWTNAGTSQSGTGNVLTFTDSGGATNQPSRFYNIQVTAP